MKLVKPKPQAPEPKREPITPFVKAHKVYMPTWDLLTAPLHKVEAKGFKP